MKVRIVGYVDKVLDLNADEEQTYLAAEAAGRLSEFMEAYVSSVGIEIAYGREEEFSGSSV